MMFQDSKGNIWFGTQSRRQKAAPIHEVRLHTYKSGKTNIYVFASEANQIIRGLVGR